jgi:hypothetical protein
MGTHLQNSFHELKTDFVGILTTLVSVFVKFKNQSRQYPLA